MGAGRWARRLLVDPLWPVVVLLAELGLAVVLLLALLGGALDRRLRLARLTAMLGYYLAVDLAILLGCLRLWLGQPLASRRDPEQWAQAHAEVLAAALDRLDAAAGRLLGLRVECETPPLPAAAAGAPLLVLCRHAGPGDSFTLARLLLRDWGRRPRVVLKAVLQADPGLDVILHRLGACFIGAAGGHGERAVRIAELAADLADNDALLLFPEGGNWTPRRWRRALSRRRRHRGRAAFRSALANSHVLPLHPGGVLAALAAQPRMSMLVVAQTGLDTLVSPASVLRAVPLHDRPLQLRWWLVAPTALPAGPSAREQFLDEQWTILDSWVDARAAGAAPTSMADPTTA